MPGLFDNFWGNEEEFKQLPLYNSLQQQAERDYFGNPVTQNQTYQSGNSYLQRLLGDDNGAYSAFQSPYMQQFQQQVIPQLSERFAGMGTGASGLNSSAFNQTLAQAGSGLQNQLAQLREQMRMQASGQGLQYSQQPYNNLLQGLGLRSFENYVTRPTTGLGQKLLGGVTGGALGYATGGPAGAAAGAARGFGGF